MKTIIILLVGLFTIIPGCIRHSDEALQRRERKKESHEIVNLISITPKLMVNDVESTVKFYKNVLGFEMVTAIPDTGLINFAIVTLDSIDIIFQRKDRIIEDIREFENKTPGGTFTLNFDVRDILMIYEKAVLNTEIVQELHQTLYGRKQFSLKDNNGYILTFSEPLSE